MPDRSFYDRFSDALRAPEEPPPPWPAADRARAMAGLAVYRNNVRSSLARALAERFPVVEDLVGGDFFKFAAREYFRTHPPRSRLLAEYGDGFPAFLERFEPAQNVPYLADVARLEIAWLEAYRAADADALPADGILAAGGGDPSRLRLTLHPSLRLLRSRFPVASIWKRCKSADKNAALPACGECVLIVRPRKEVIVRTVTDGEYAAVGALGAGETVASAFETGLAADKEFNPQNTFKILFECGATVAAELA